MSSRKQNERKFGNWVDLPGVGRQYWCEITGRQGWKARYVKIVDSHERIVRFYQEIYDSTGQVIEVHEKYPVDKGHRKVRSS